MLWSSLSPILTLDKLCPSQDWALLVPCIHQSDGTCDSQSHLWHNWPKVIWIILLGALKHCIQRIEIRFGDYELSFRSWWWKWSWKEYFLVALNLMNQSLSAALPFTDWINLVKLLEFLCFSFLIHNIRKKVHSHCSIYVNS